MTGPHSLPFRVVIKDQKVEDEKALEEWERELKTMLYVLFHPFLFIFIFLKMCFCSDNRSPYVAQVFGFAKKESDSGLNVSIVMEYFRNGDLYGPDTSEHRVDVLLCFIFASSKGFCTRRSRRRRSSSTLCPSCSVFAWRVTAPSAYWFSTRIALFIATLRA